MSLKKLLNEYLSPELNDIILDYRHTDWNREFFWALNTIRIRGYCWEEPMILAPGTALSDSFLLYLRWSNCFVEPFEIWLNQQRISTE